MSIWGEWFIETAWGWRPGEDSPELLVAWDYYSFEQNEVGFREEIERAFADNQIDEKTLRRVRLKINGDQIMELYETPEVEIEIETVEDNSWAKHACPRCGSDEWAYCDYGGCSECRSHGGS